MWADRTKYKSYDDQRLLRAYEEVVLKGISIRRAAADYGIPHTTLADRVSGRVGFGKKSGPSKYLTEREEEELVNFVCRCAEIGYGYSRKDILEIVQETCWKKGLSDVIVTFGWWESFKKRHPDLVLRQPEPLSRHRAESSAPSVLEKYFKELESTLIENDIIDKPAQLFNADESGFPLDPKQPNVICKRGMKHPSVISSGNKSQITVLACCNAAGYAIPPLVIFNRKTLKPELTLGEVPGTMYSHSSSGWIDSEIFDLWFNNHFLPYAPASRPLLLLLDGHSSHYNPSTIKRAAEEHVIIFCLPPNTTHKTQPLDKGCFAPLKSYWRDECHKYCRENFGKVVTLMQFSQLFSRAWAKGMSMTNICGGFRITGIYPFDPYVLIPQKIPSVPPVNLCQETGLKYIPLYSPHPQFKRVIPVESDEDINISFSEEEHVRYQRRFEEGYDLSDERYEQWLQMYKDQPSLSSSPIENQSSVNAAPHYTTSLASILTKKASYMKLPDQSNRKTSSRVLTSVENMKIIQEKERKKEEMLRQKELRQLERQQKKQKREEETKIKQMERMKKQNQAKNQKGTSSQRRCNVRTLSKESDEVTYFAKNLSNEFTCSTKNDEETIRTNRRNVQGSSGISDDVTSGEIHNVRTNRRNVQGSSGISEDVISGEIHNVRTNRRNVQGSSGISEDVISGEIHNVRTNRRNVQGSSGISDDVTSGEIHNVRTNRRNVQGSSGISEDVTSGEIHNVRTNRRNVQGSSGISEDVISGEIHNVRTNRRNVKGSSGISEDVTSGEIHNVRTNRRNVKGSSGISEDVTSGEIHNVRTNRRNVQGSSGISEDVTSGEIHNVRTNRRNVQGSSGISDDVTSGEIHNVRTNRRNVQGSSGISDDVISGEIHNDGIAANETVESLCVLKKCCHPRAYTWIQCDYCHNWYHCSCAGISFKNIKNNDQIFQCNFCK